MFKYAFLILLLINLSTASASYIIASYNTAAVNVKLPTRVLVAGSGDDLGLLFEEVAKAKALKYAQSNASEQIVFIAVNEKEMGSEQALKKWGFQILRISNNTLDGKELVQEVSKFKQILSLDIFSHSSAQFGVHLDGRANRLNRETKKIESLKANFTADAYVYLHGCNTGFNLAPFLSKLWEIPVAGSLTSTNFQRLHTDGHFYLSEEGLAPNSDWSKENTRSFNEVQKCSSGTCQRLKPDNTPYVGFWGAYREGGLPFYKFFCVKNKAEDCVRIMAKSLLSHTLIVNLKKESTREEYKEAVIDFLCPVSSKVDLRSECRAKLDEALLTQDMTYNPFSRAQVECSFSDCMTEVSCEKVLFTGLPKPGTCKLQNTNTQPATTLVREYKAYLDGYQYLAK